MGKEFLKRGLMAAAGGPIILAVVYYFLGRYGVITGLSVNEVVRGILTVTLLAFIAGGIPVVYQADRLSLMAATLIHALVLYGDYILIYLFNGWLRSSQGAILVFTLLFFTGYAGIWLLIFTRTRKAVARLNRDVEGGGRNKTEP